MEDGVNRETLAWAAGILDGEGHVHYRLKDTHKGVDRKANSIGIMISNTDLELLERWQAAIGGMGKIFGPYDQTKYYKTGKPLYKYAVHGFEKCQAIIAMLYPWLCAYRKEQAVSALQNQTRNYTGYPRWAHEHDPVTGRFLKRA